MHSEQAISGASGSLQSAVQPSLLTLLYEPQYVASHSVEGTGISRSLLQSAVQPLHGILKSSLAPQVLPMASHLPVAPLYESPVQHSDALAAFCPAPLHELHVGGLAIVLQESPPQHCLEEQSCPVAAQSCTQFFS